MTPSEAQSTLDKMAKGEITYDDNLKAAANRALGGGGGGGGNTGSNSVVDMAQQMYQLSQKFQEPALQTLKTSGEKIPGIYQAQYANLEAQKQPLQARYDALLASITKGTRDVATKEFSQRGIPLSSGLTEQTVQARLAPQIMATEAERMAGLQNITGLQSGLTTQEAQDQQNLARAIALIQSQSGQEGISGGLSAWNTQEQARQAELSRQLQESQFNTQQSAQASENAFNQNIASQQLTLQQQAQAASLAKANAPAKATQAELAQSSKQQLLNQAQKGATLSQLVSQFGSGLSLQDIVGLYTGTGYYKSKENPSGAPTESWAQQYLGNTW